MKDKSIIPNIAQTFYDSIASQYEKYYPDWNSASKSEADFLSTLFRERGFDHSSRILDCACGIGTQTIGLAALGYQITGSDISAEEIAEAKKRAAEMKVDICLKQADFCALSDSFPEKFEIIIAMDNALPHMLTSESLAKAIKSIVDQLCDGGLFVASIRDYDQILKTKPAYSAPYVFKTDTGQRILFQTWDWHGENYRFIQYIIEDEKALSISRFTCEYRAVRRDEISDLLYSCGCSDIQWKMPEVTGFYQPIVLATKQTKGSSGE